MFKKLALTVLSMLVLAAPLSMVAHADTTTPNLIPNPSLETSANGTAPDSWSSSDYSSTTTANKATFSYLNTGHTGSHSLETNVTSFAGGSENWYYNEVPVTAGQTYQFSDWYKSNIDTEVDYEVTINGVVSYGVVGKPFASTDWSQYSTTWTAPAGATSVSIYHLIAGVGTLTTDDYSLTAYTPTPFSAPVISVTFDDGWANQYTNALPAMQANGIPGTFYIISDEVQNTTPADGSDYMDQAQVKSLFAAGNEIGSHTIDHCEMTTGLTEPGGPACPGFNLNNEMTQSKATLESLVGTGNVTDFAYPYGSYNSTTIAAGQAAGYKSQRTVNPGYNSKDNFDATQLKMYEVDTTTTVAQVEAWVDGAIANNAWLILTYHEVANTAAQGDAGYNATPADFATEMAYIKSKASVAHIETVSKALAEVQSQLGTVTPPVVIPGDINGDSRVDALDLSTLLTNWNKAGATAGQGDLNSDNTVDALDLSTLLTNWSK
jgi:peptidoglycan/xylan/chitin deacetylase (PgdA/CDA1 family)